MGMIGIGGKPATVAQVAYVVEDIEASMKAYVEHLGVGPWFVAGPFNPPKPVYRGKVVAPLFTLALAYSGDLMIELIQQHDDKPSVIREAIASRGYGFHHWGVVVRDFDEEVARYQRKGFEIAFSDTAPMGMRVAYMDTMKVLPGMIELIEGNAAFEAAFNPIREASIGWDGRDPIRKA